MSLLDSFVLLLQPLATAMTQPSFRRFVTLMTGWIFARRRVLTQMLWAAGVAQSHHHAAYHRFFAAARWSRDHLGLLLLRLILPLLGDGPIYLTLDDTLARKCGKQVYGVGMHHDPLQSSRNHTVTSWGHCWVILGVVVRAPWNPSRVFSLPFLVRLYLNHQASHRAHKTQRSRPELGVDLLRVLARAFPGRRFHLLADSTYGGQSVLKYLPRGFDLTSRLPLDARLYEAPPARRPGQRGRPRKRGARLPSPRALLQKRAQHLDLQIYGRHCRQRVVDTVARWHSVPDRPLRIVAVEPLSGGRPAQAFYSTCIEQSAEQVLTVYAFRWSMEEAIQGGKSHLGFEEPQGWSRQAVRRTAPMALLLYSLVVLWFIRVGHNLYHIPVCSWYRRKSQPSFADMLQTLRRESFRQVISAHLGSNGPSQNLLDALCSAAFGAP